MAEGIKKVFQTSLTDIATTDLEGIGTIRFEGNNIYKYVRYEAAAAAVAGVAGEACYYDATDTAPIGYINSVVTSDTSASDNTGAGILQAALTDGDYGWIQIKGLATMTIALTAGADGDVLTPVGAGDGTLDVIAAFTSQACAYSIDVTNKTIVCDFPF